MKTSHIIRLPSALVAGALLLGAIASSDAQTFLDGSYTNKFDTGGNPSPYSGSGSVASWIYWYNTPGGNTPMTNDVTKDVANDPNSGSLLVDSPFPAVNPGDNQNVFFGTFGNRFGYDFDTRANMLLYSNITFYIRVDPSMPTNAAGNFGTIGVGIINSGYGYQEFGRPTIPAAASNSWVQLSVNVDLTQNNLASVPGIALDYNAYNGGYPLFPFRFWIDNLVVYRAPGPPPPPPTVAMQKVLPGLTQFADSAPTYNRQTIRSDTSGSADLTWYGRTKPVSYSWTVTDFPGAGHAGFQMALNISPDPIASQIYSDFDWSATNDLWININALADGSVRAGIAYKTNQASGNGQLFGGPGQLVPGNTTNGLSVASAVGTWTLTFTSDTDMVLTGPGGATTNATLPPDIAALFNGPVGVSFYSAPNDVGNIGQHITLTGYHITGVNTPVNEDFTSGSLSSPYLLLNSQNYFYTGNYTPNPPNQQFVTSADAYWLRWTKPDAGFLPVYRSSLNTGAWLDVGLTNNFSNGTERWLKIPKSLIGTGSQNYFGLVKRNFTKLQVLLPGESNAPDTLTGKTGTPDPQSQSTFVVVTINAVDPTFHIVSSTDSINLSSSDGSDVMPLDAPLVDGSLQQSIQVGTPGARTITATDVTDGTKTPGTSSTLNVN